MGRDSLGRERRLIGWARDRAKKSGVPCTITIDDIEIPKECPVLGIALFSGDGVSCDNSPTIDRIVPEVGYVPGNVIVISNRANRVKSNATWFELTQLVDFYEEHITQHWMKEKPNEGISSL